MTHETCGWESVLVGCHHNFLGREATVKGSMKAVLKWLGANWMWLTIVGVILPGVGWLGVKIFFTYAATFPYISDKHEAWASFGSLLAGFFTLTGTVATVATLLFLAHQNKTMQKVTQAQLDTLTFERYINHRKLFFDQLDSLVTAHKNTFRFRDPSHLYSALFPENSPHHCVFKVEAAYDINGVPSNRVAEIYAWFDSIKSFESKDDFTDMKSNMFLGFLINLQERILMYESTAQVRDGDLSFIGKTYGINIYSLELFFEPALHIVNALLRFSGSAQIDRYVFNYNTENIRAGLVRNNVSMNTVFPIKVVRTIKGLPLLYFAYAALREYKELHKYLIPELVVLLGDLFYSAESVNSLADGNVFNQVAGECFARVNNIGPPESPELLDKYNNIHATLKRLLYRKSLDA